MQNATLAKLWPIIYATHATPTSLPLSPVSPSLSLSPTLWRVLVCVSIALCCSTQRAGVIDATADC